MMRHLFIALAATALLPRSGEAQEAPYPGQGEQAGAYQPPPPPPAPDAYGEANVDVSVDLATPGAQVSFDTFRDGLSQYGQWVTVGGYGTVWRPAGVAPGWRPYYYGRWEWTNEGWLWVSDEPWGWAAYHYGRWGYDPAYGWFWIPGYQWAPAWVTWRYGPEYIGWAPLGPGFSVYVTSYPIAYGWWTFVPCQRFAGVPVWNVAYTGAHVRGIFHATQPAPPRAALFGAPGPAWGGPARPFVEQRVGHPIAPVRVQAVPSPHAVTGAQRSGVVPIYRPEVRVPPGRSSVPAPVPAPPRPSAAQPGAPGYGGPQGGPGRAVGAVQPPPRATPASPGQAIQHGSAGAAPHPQVAPAPQQGARTYTPGPGAHPARPPAAHVPAPQGGSHVAPAPAPGAAPRPSGGGTPHGAHGQGGGGGHAPTPHRR